MAEIKQTKRASKVLKFAMDYCRGDRHEFITPEHLLLAMMRDDSFVHVLADFARPDEMCDELFMQMVEWERMPEEDDYEPEASAQMGQVIDYACQQVLNSSAQTVDIPHLVTGILHLEDSWACYILKKALGDDEGTFMSQLISAYDFEDHLERDVSEHKAD